MAQLMPVFLASVKSGSVLPLWYRLTRVVPQKRAVKCVCVCVYACVRVCVCVSEICRRPVCVRVCDVQKIDASNMSRYIGDVRQSVRFAVSDLKHGDGELPGFCLPKKVC